MTTTLKSRVIKTESTDWKKFSYIQQKDFKELDPIAKERLKKSMIDHNFSQPFYVWHLKRNGDSHKIDCIFCLDGRHRTLLLEELEQEGYTIPAQLPATFIHCKDERDAAKMVLVYSSQYAAVTQTGLSNFLEKFSIPFDEFQETVRLPGFDEIKFNGDTDRDFSINNHELNIDDFKNEVTLKFTFSKDDYLTIKAAIRDRMNANNLATPEDLIKKLLGIE